MESVTPTPAGWGAEARQVFVRQLIADLPGISEQIRSHLLQRSDEVVFGEEAQRLRDAYLRFKAGGKRWEEQASARLRGQVSSQPVLEMALEHRLEGAEFSLVGKEAVENQILAARAALVMVDKSSEVFNELRLRLQSLDAVEDLDKKDIVQALQLAQWLVDAWLKAGLLRLDWQMCQTILHKHLAKWVLAAYVEANRYLIEKGVLPEIDLRRLMRRSAIQLAPGAAFRSAPPSEAGSSEAGFGTGQGQLTHVMPLSSTRGGAMAGPENGTSATLPAFHALQSQVAAGLSGYLPAASFQKSGPQEVTRRLLHFFSQQLPQSSWGGQPSTGSPLLSASSCAVFPAMDWSSLEAGVAGLRAQSRVLKKAARSDNEKAVIELVALMFDSILSEDRIPPSIRLWFARLQMPVLRTALADPVFFTAEDHPARRLLDRMGSCVLGFDPSVKLDRLEAEIKRIVQVIEQYPETGRKAFELMLREFEDFLRAAVHEHPEVHQVVDMVSQLEMKETLTIQYTIEMRKLLTDAPVHDSLRTFLFETWTEVMSQAAVVYGEKHEKAASFRALASDLLWAASAKPTRQERAQVIARVPALMAHVREGLALLGYDDTRIEKVLQPVSDALAVAFMSKAAAIDPAWLARLTQQLNTLEDVLPEAQSVDWVLNPESLEMLTGEQADHLVVLPNPETRTPRHLLAWAATLPLGGWHALEHNGKETIVQLAWQSPKKHLYLFVNGVRQSWLMQPGRVAMYLKAGLLRPGEGEALTTRATRQALSKLEANPERLLQTD